MDAHRFDCIARTLASPRSRRALLTRLLGAASMAIASLSVSSRQTRASHCSSDGCSCRTGGNVTVCNDGLVCCPMSQTIPGPGTCLTEDECYFSSGCSSEGTVCAHTCGWNTFCDDCCSGYCGGSGTCEN